MIKNIYLVFVGIVLFTLVDCSTNCQKSTGKSIKIVASAVPHAEMLEEIRAELKEQGIDLKIIVTDDYNMPNRAVAEKEADANFFQHQPYFDEQVKLWNYPLIALTTVELEPMGVYSRRIKSLESLNDHAKVAIPNDPTNEGRALLMLEKEGLIGLDNAKNLNTTVMNIIKNPKNLQFIEVDAAMVPRALEDVDVAVINTNYALQARLSPLNDALILEGKDSPYTNILVIRTADKERTDLQALAKALTSEKMKEFILKKYQGAVIPAF